MQSRTLNLSVAEFAIPCPRTGSIEPYSGLASTADAGLTIHNQIHSERIKEYPGYIPEKWIAHSFQINNYKLNIGSRLDGFIPPDCIEEIKISFNIEGLMSALDKNPEQHPYILQIYTFAYLYFLNTQIIPKAQLTLVCARTGSTTVKEILLDFKQYEQWFKLRLNELIKEDKLFKKIKNRRKNIAQELKFPFADCRPGQNDLMTTIQDGLGKSINILIQAPTGLGKTAAITVPILKESFKRGQKTIYVTPKNSQHTVAEDVAQKLRDQGSKIKTLTLNSKAKLCLKDEVLCNPEYCEYAKDHYTKVTESNLVASLSKKKKLSAKTFRTTGIQYQVCPFELQLDLIPKFDFIIGDYNYVFSPRSIIGRISNNGFGKTTPPNLIVDEAHNLPNRAVDYFSASLSYDYLLNTFNESKGLHFDLNSKVEDLLRLIRLRIVDLASELGTNSQAVIKFNVVDFNDVSDQAQELLSQYLDSNSVGSGQDHILKIYNHISSFVETVSLIDDNFFCTYSPGQQGGILKIVCCDASSWLKKCYANFANVIAFSATLKPFAYYSQILGFDQDRLLTSEFKSPFPKSNRKLLIIPQISTRARDRDSNYDKIRDSIERIVQVKEGNYFAFFPSFDFLYQVLKRINLPNFNILAQSREMTKDSINAVLNILRSGIKPTLVFAVQGGVFSEGVDYPGNMLIGALIIGPALPTFDFEREHLRKYYEQKYGHGFEYAYTYPAMAKVIQSAGRVIRSSDDKGIIILMDRRFTHKNYLESMPSDWTDSEPLVSNSILADLDQFWKRHQ